MISIEPDEMIIGRESPVNVGESGINLLISTHLQMLYWNGVIICENI